MIDYYNLYDYCQQRTKELKKIRDTKLKNKEIKLKNRLFKEIISDADKEIKRSVNLGYSSAYIYEGEYSRLVEELLDQNFQIKAFCYLQRIYRIQSLGRE